jgi:hypothetical protein
VVSKVTDQLSTPTGQEEQPNACTATQSIDKSISAAVGRLEQVILPPKCQPTLSPECVDQDHDLDIKCHVTVPEKVNIKPSSAGSQKHHFRLSPAEHSGKNHVLLYCILV